MPKKCEFVLKDSPLDLIEAADVEPKGRSYDEKFAKKPGGVSVEDVLLGTKLACIAITDDKPGTLSQVGKLNPWHIEALKMITGSEEEAQMPLSYILDKHFGLQCDKIIDISGWAGCTAIDTQGYIAHNDDIIVVSFRCTTTALDWLTNFNATSSEWELDVDLPQGRSGMFSSLEGWGSKKPRVHTGFYNNILKTIPVLEEYVKPLLAADQPPRKLYVVGHSLGASISIMATCYFLLNFDWSNLPHKLVNVSAGTPRSCKESMSDLINKKLEELRPLDKAISLRIGNNQDLVCTIPPGFSHIGKLVYLTEDGEVLVGPNVDDGYIIDEEEAKELQKNNSSLVMEAKMSREEMEDGSKDYVSSYEKMMSMIPRPLKDHMPDQYLRPIIKLYERETGERQVWKDAVPSSKVSNSNSSSSGMISSYFHNMYFIAILVVIVAALLAGYNYID